MKKIGICGHFGYGRDLSNGQTIKTINIYNGLVKSYGEENIATLDTCGWNKHPIAFLLDCIKIIKSCDNLIILPAQNGLKIFLPLYVFFKKIYKTNLIYAVVGGWLPEFISNKRFLKSCLKKIDITLVETNSMAMKLKQLGIKNVDVLLNFKNINILKESQIKKSSSDNIKTCTFSRVIKEKGIENAIKAITEVNKHCERKFILDIYGPVANEYEEEFNTILTNADIDGISYKGIVSAEESVEIIKQYDLLLFPTYYEGEGLAGTIIDAFSAGVPVVASDWKYNCDVITDKENGFIHKTKNDEQLITILKEIYDGKYDILNMKKNCLKEARKYNAEEAIKGLIKYIK